jgi:putative ABC transport system ATP-binding protein
MIGLGERIEHTPSQLSGGQQQRVAIARALANRPQVVLADEPTGNLDSVTGAEVLAELQRLNREQQQTIILVTHDPAIAECAPRLVTVKDGLIASDVDRLRRQESGVRGQGSGIRGQESAVREDGRAVFANS